MFAPARRPLSAKGASRDLTYVLFAASVVFAPMIAARVAVIFVIKEVHIIVQIVEDRAQLRTTVLRTGRVRLRRQRYQAHRVDQFDRDGAVIPRSAALIRKKTKLNRSRLIVLDAISARSSRLRCAQCVD